MRSTQATNTRPRDELGVSQELLRNAKNFPQAYLVIHCPLPSLWTLILYIDTHRAFAVTSASPIWVRWSHYTEQHLTTARLIGWSKWVHFANLTFAFYYYFIRRCSPIVEYVVYNQKPFSSLQRNIASRFGRTDLSVASLPRTTQTKTYSGCVRGPLTCSSGQIITAAILTVISNRRFPYKSLVFRRIWNRTPERSRSIVIVNDFSVRYSGKVD